ncbi:MAG: hypothetical protein J6Y55_11040 [Bacteroidales bacterium]|nr:hypothetical protein [Bacteroidales bacterium]
MSKEREIKDVIQQIAGDGERSQGLFFVADVVSASDDVCDVQVDGLTLTDVRTGAIADSNANKLRIKPKVGSKVMVADLYGDKTQLIVVAFSEVDSITINGGTLGGLVKIQELKTQLNKMSNRIDGIMDALRNSAVVAQDGGAAYKTNIIASLATITDKENFSNMEDTKIKH